MCVRGRNIALTRLESIENNPVSCAKRGMRGCLNRYGGEGEQQLGDYMVSSGIYIGRWLAWHGRLEESRAAEQIPGERSEGFHTAERGQLRVEGSGIIEYAGHANALGSLYIDIPIPDHDRFVCRKAVFVHQVAKRVGRGFFRKTIFAGEKIRKQCGQPIGLEL